jgi:hypothetical protein
MKHVKNQESNQKLELELQKSKLKIKQGASIIKEARSAPKKKQKHFGIS